MLRLISKPTLAGIAGAESRRVVGFRKLRTLVHADEGQSLVEFAVVTPFLLLILLGIVAFGVAFWNQLTLTNATNLAAQSVYTLRQSNAVDLCNPVNTALYNAGTGINNPLAPTPLTFSILTGPAGSTTPPATALASNVAVKSTSVTTCPATLTTGEVVAVTTSYGCNLNFFGFKLASACKLTANTTEAIQ